MITSYPQQYSDGAINPLIYFYRFIDLDSLNLFIQNRPPALCLYRKLRSSRGNTKPSSQAKTALKPCIQAVEVSKGKPYCLSSWRLVSTYLL